VIGVIAYGLMMAMAGVCVLFLVWVVLGAVRDREWKTAGGMSFFALAMAAGGWVAYERAHIRYLRAYPPVESVANQAEAIPNTEPPLP
jgi:hypothetical protein